MYRSGKTNVNDINQNQLHLTSIFKNNDSIYVIPFKFLFQEESVLYYGFYKQNCLRRCEDLQAAGTRDREEHFMEYSRKYTKYPGDPPTGKS